jgi:hypothetical protein
LHNRVYGQDDVKVVPVTRLARDFNLPVTGVYDDLGNRQTQPEVTGRTGAGAVETLKKMREVLRCCRTVSVQDYTNFSRCCLRYAGLADRHRVDARLKQEYESA